MLHFGSQHVYVRTSTVDETEEITYDDVIDDSSNDSNYACTQDRKAMLYGGKAQFAPFGKYCLAMKLSR